MSYQEKLKQTNIPKCVFISLDNMKEMDEFPDMWSNKAKSK